MLLSLTREAHKSNSFFLDCYLFYTHASIQNQSRPPRFASPRRVAPRALCAQLPHHTPPLFIYANVPSSISLWPKLLPSTRIPTSPLDPDPMSSSYQVRSSLILPSSVIPTPRSIEPSWRSSSPTLPIPFPPVDARPPSAVPRQLSVRARFSFASVRLSPLRTPAAPRGTIPDRTRTAQASPC
jgi:hypothetical protein